MCKNLKLNANCIYKYDVFEQCVKDLIICFDYRNNDIETE